MKRPNASSIFVFLVFLMLATRADHFGSAINLPDGSLAAFFMSGFLLASRRVFPVLCVLAAAIDYWMIEYNGVSAFCVTPAYGFLLPTYFVMWWSGVYCGKLDLASGKQWLGLAALVALAIGAAHLISSGSFYLLAPYFTQHSLAEFGQRTALYFPRYFMVTAGYLATLLVLSKLAFRSKSANRTTSGIATGTGTDAQAIFCGDGAPAAFAGKHTLFGERLGQLTMAALRDPIGRCGDRVQQLEDCL